MQLWAVVVLAALAGAVSAQLQVPVDSSGNYRVLVNGIEWLRSAPTFFTSQNKMVSQMDGSLKLTQMSTSSGADAGGSFNETILSFQAGSDAFMSTIRVYASHVVFAQVFPQTVMNANVSGDRNTVASGFPSFYVENSSSIPARGYLSFQGDMCGSSSHTGNWDSSTGGIGTGISGSGPIVIFSGDMKTSLVISAFSNFMAHTTAMVSPAHGSVVSWGYFGAAPTVPHGFVLETILVVSSGVNQAMEDWGDFMLTRYNKERYGYQRDYALTHLGYSTDNGAYYYYWTEGNKTYEDTLIDVANYAKSLQIPYKYILLDSWWYFKSANGDGVTEWDAMPSVFPHGIEYLYNMTGWNQQLHNRFWAPDNVYAKQNGGQWDFIVEEKYALPIEQEFWDWLMLEKRKTGMFMYEQDWLDTEFDNLQAFGSNITLGRTWMMMMGQAAQRNGVTIQMCMSHVRHILQSVESASYTNARASGDYQPGNGQWNIGTSSILAHALGIAPTKDNYWSTPNQPGNPKYNGHTETRNRLQAAVSTLSSGPVAPSDMIGKSDAALILKSCTAGGLLLQPDRPATEIDSKFAFDAFGNQGPNGHVWSTHVDAGNGLRYAYVLVVDLAKDYMVTLADMRYYDLSGKYKAFESNITSASNIFNVDASTPIHASACGETNFQFYTVAPVLPNGWTLLGELNKWVSVSRQRFGQSLSYTTSNAWVEVTGDVGETIYVSFLSPTNTLITATCVIPSDSKINVVVGAGVGPQGFACSQP